MQYIFSKEQLKDILDLEYIKERFLLEQQCKSTELEGIQDQFSGMVKYSYDDRQYISPILDIGSKIEIKLSKYFVPIPKRVRCIRGSYVESSMSNELLQLMEDQNEKDFTENSKKQHLQQMLQNTFLNIILDGLDICISSLLIFVYIYQTYDVSPYTNTIWGVFNTALRCLLLMEWIIKLYLVKNLQVYILSMESLIQMVSLGPFLLIKVSTLMIFVDDGTWWLMLADLLCLIRILEFDRLGKYLESEINKQLLTILVQVTALVLTASAVLQLFSSTYFGYAIDNPAFTFDYVIYLTMTTLSTVGYSNPFATETSRVLIIVLIIFALTFVPIQTGELIRHLSAKSQYARIVYKVSEAVPHIVILGSITNISAENFFKELFNDDHGLQQKHAIILSPNMPDPVLEAMIQTPDYQNIIYIQGDPHLDKDLKRCQIEKAKAIVIMCNKQSIDPASEDSKIILLAIVIKNYLKQLKLTTKIRFCMQILRYEGKTHYYLSLNKQTKLDQVICVEELKMALLAKACLCPGLIAIISNLITSSGPPPTDLSLDWLKDYWAGQNFEIYKTVLPNFFRGKTFTQTVLILYKKFQVILFGIEIISAETEHIFLNPGDMNLPTQTTQKIMGYIISQDKDTADQIALYKTGESGRMRTETTSRFVEKENLTRRKTVMEIFQSFLGFATNEPAQRTKTKKKRSREMSIVQLNKSQGGWVRMRSYNPSQEAATTIKEVEDNVEDDEELEEEYRDNQFKNKFKQENFRNLLQMDYNKTYQNCHKTNEKVNLKDVTFKSLENSILVINHIILCGIVMNLNNFIIPLRNKYLDKYPAVVILNEQEPTEKQWNQICQFPEIYFVKGSAMNQKDLLKANIMRASKVVILSPQVEEVMKARFDGDREEQQQDPCDDQQLQLTKDQEDLLDTRTIFKYRNIIRLKPNIQIVTEFISPQNLQFLLYDKDYALMKQFGYNHSPIFASGQVYFSSVMDYLLCQSYYNPALVTVINQLLLGNSNTNHQDQEKQPIPSLQSEQYNDVIPSNLYQMQVPIAFQKKPFDKLFFYLVKVRNIVPLGLYRLPGSSDNKQPYVSTNPDPNTIVNDKDLVLILAQEQPPIECLNWGGPLEEKRKVYERTHNVYQKQTTTSSDEQDIILINEDNDKEVQKAKLFNSQSEQVIKRIQLLIEELNKCKEETKQLDDLMRQRQDRIIVRLKKIFMEELQQIQLRKMDSVLKNEEEK